MVRPGALHGRYLHQWPSRYGGKYRPGNGLHGQGQVIDLSAALRLVQFDLMMRFVKMVFLILCDLQ